jgi:hypothetical protein
VGDVASVWEVHAATIIRFPVCRLVSCCVCIAFCFEDEWGRGIDWGLALHLGHSLPVPFQNNAVYTQQLTNLQTATMIDDSMYLQNVSNIAHNHAVQQPRNRIFINLILFDLIYFVSVDHYT